MAIIAADGIARTFFISPVECIYLMSVHVVPKVCRLLRDEGQSDRAHPRPVGGAASRGDRTRRPLEPLEADGPRGRGNGSRDSSRTLDMTNARHRPPGQRYRAGLTKRAAIVTRPHQNRLINEITLRKKKY